uniref:DUF5641 domain-containing protein n=1 Tax=Parascaris equorum TaxID=6256 RepID=A0A914R186_PAREQ
MQNTVAAPITWRFITPFAPWEGGVYERLVGLTETAFRKAVGRRLLDEEEFKTLVVECEAIVNSRPLTYVNSHTADRRGKQLGLWKATISSLERFWKIWTHDYVMSLRASSEGLPRAEWRLGKVEKLHKNHLGKTKAVDVKMPNGHVLKRPVNMLYPLEVLEEEREMQPGTKSKEFAEEREEEEESRTKPKTTKTMYAHALSIVLV